jgi:pilus assembly protein CpaF
VPARLEALAALGGLDRAALHSQLAAAVQVVLHVSRGSEGRRLTEIALLRRDRSGHVGTVPAWHVGRGPQDGMEPLGELLAARGAW